MIENKVKISTEQEHALHLMVSKKNVFISRNAAAGKIFVVKELEVPREHLDKVRKYLATLT